jgi:hypothetical protein
MKIVRLSALLLCVAAGSAFADPQGGPPGGGSQGGPQAGQHHVGPPPEALAACKGLAVGAKAEMKMPRGDAMSGTCQLVLVPDHKPGGNEGGGMPPSRQQ